MTTITSACVTGRDSYRTRGGLELANVRLEKP